MKTLYVTGGQQRKQSMGINEWSQYEAGIILAIDVDSKTVLAEKRYVSSPEYHSDEPNAAITFKSASFEHEYVDVCTQTEILRYRLADFEELHHISNPIFNDVHHVLPSSHSTFFVVVTGLDLLVEISQDGECLNEWNMTGTPTWSRFSKSVDYRKVISTKPHESHPNYVFEINGELWVTRFEHRDAVCVSGSDRRINIGIERPHDGYVFGSEVAFTTVDGHIVIADTTSCDVTRQYDLSEILGSDNPLGWCRGLQMLTETKCLVGFSRIRPTKFHKNILWLKDRITGSNQADSMPTRITLVDLERKTLEWEIDLEQHGLNAVFTIHSASD